MNFKQFPDLSKRLLTSLCISVIVILLLIFSKITVVSFILLLVVCGMAAIGVWEYAKLARTKGLEPSTFLMITVAISVVLSFFIAHQWIRSQELPVFVLAIGAGLFFLNRFRRAEDALANIAVEFFGVTYVAVPLGYMLAILYPINEAIPQDGRWWLFYLILVTKITDMGAYFVGRIWGKTPLAPMLSPKKTVEGAIGGLFAAVLFSVCMVYFGRIFAGTSFPLDYTDAFGLGFVIGIFGQIGDLAESLFKRDAEVKDSNRIPGIGGVLDLIDSLIFTAPIVYFYLKWYYA